jgi:hypothetical protein
MPHRIPTRHIPKMRKHRMNTRLRLRRIKIKLHPPILPRNVSLPLHLHTPQLRLRIRRHPMPRPKIIAAIHEPRRHNYPDNHTLQNHRPSRIAIVATSAVLVVALFTHESNTSLFLAILMANLSRQLAFSAGFSLFRISGLRGHISLSVGYGTPCPHAADATCATQPMNSMQGNYL